MPTTPRVRPAAQPAPSPRAPTPPAATPVQAGTASTRPPEAPTPAAFSRARDTATPADAPTTPSRTPAAAPAQTQPAGKARTAARATAAAAQRPTPPPATAANDVARAKTEAAQRTFDAAAAARQQALETLLNIAASKGGTGHPDRLRSSANALSDTQARWREAAAGWVAAASEYSASTGRLLERLIDGASQPDRGARRAVSNLNAATSAAGQALTALTATGEETTRAALAVVWGGQQARLDDAQQAEARRADAHAAAERSRQHASRECGYHAETLIAAWR
jgi:hypothetical protein